MTARRALRVPVLLKRAVVQALAHDVLNLGQSAAYSAMVALFPALIVAAAGVAVLPDVTGLRGQIGYFVREVLPAPVFPLVKSYFEGAGPHTLRALATASFVSLLGGSSVMATLMEGLARAEKMPVHGSRAAGAEGRWTFWQARGRALVLAAAVLIPLVVATTLVMFGQYLSLWLGAYLPAGPRGVFLAAVLVVRWAVALAGVAGVTALIYHVGSPKQRHWKRTVPGAVVATLLWFATTLAFGWYVTRFANYREVYGSLGTGIALLVWLYLVFLSVLCGAEFNVQFFRGTEEE